MSCTVRSHPPCGWRQPRQGTAGRPAGFSDPSPTNVRLRSVAMCAATVPLFNRAAASVLDYLLPGCRLLDELQGSDADAIWQSHMPRGHGSSGQESVTVAYAGKLVWSTNISAAATDSSHNGTVAVISDIGNLVLRRHEEDGEVLWQSMDHPTDTWLPGFRIGLNKLTGEVQTLTAWKNYGDPAPGAYSLGIDPNGTSQFFISWNRTTRFWGSGEWNGDIFSGIPEMTSHYIYNFEFVSGANASYFTYSLQDPSVISRLVMDISGQIRQLTWVPSLEQWMLIWTEPHQLCDVHAVCGAFGVCDEKGEPLCSCLSGFRPVSAGDWELGDRTLGCRRNTPPQLCDDNAFLLMQGISLPRRNPSFAQASSAEEDCRLVCMRNCDCNAYAYGSGCALWYGDLVNLQKLADDTAGGGNGLFVRMSATMDDDVPSKGRKKTIALASSLAAILALSATLSIFVMMMYKRRQRTVMRLRHQAASEGGYLLMAFKYSDVRRATRNFSEKIGGGSFGSVYKGTLPGGNCNCNASSVAVKRLEGLPCLGEKQFRNEVRTIGTIHHVNLVRLRGFSSRGTDRLLVYDYMPNGSLDKALFFGRSRPGAAMSTTTPVLSWRARFQIALGAARGLLYLHDGCRDRIIHCDVKPENILLDGDLVAKVADFGMAKLVGREFSRVLTTVRGTIGYLAPEWISGVPITVKADVYSYGMVLMEIISGRRNARCCSSSSPEEEKGMMVSEYFPLVAARMVSRGEPLVGLLDDRLKGDVDERELDRACRVACWCVQDDEADRPTMEQVVQALEGVVDVDVPPIPTSLQAFSDDAGPATSLLTGAYHDGCFHS
ncbi:hypothetical protein PR202_ga14591 [Eleusine coracana subsp. coracana]|uniref:Receptor-like serine/threonine-protein kinase n=1 Tax=Eleusine coracana subsp. coracana TaxID=191504 RepID=A0AAV5CHY7_ELECO|nr:hypothetical protein PR202_ga14591 [Eleusine coracana subsp. coracana]